MATLCCSSCRPRSAPSRNAAMSPTAISSVNCMAFVMGKRHQCQDYNNSNSMNKTVRTMATVIV
eukprot:scaffold81907_cov30-Prasinocladus_malaysianus.AAC.1